MRVFTSPLAFAEHLLKASLAVATQAHAGLEACAKLIQVAAQKEIGHLQPAVGPFGAWDELADATKEDKARKGYWFNDEYNPLLRTGELMASIQYEVSALEAVIGSKSMIMAYQEFGTSRGIPARPVIGPAAYKNKEKIRAILGLAVITGLTGGAGIHPSLGYNMET